MNSGKIIYTTKFISNPNWPQIGQASFSQSFIQQSTSANNSDTTFLSFKGNQTVKEGSDNQYGFYSPYIQIRKGEEKEFYCKKFHKLSWYIEYPLPVPLIEKEQITVTFLPEEEEIAGYSCKKARLQEADLATDVYYTDKIEVSLPGHLWLKNEAIPGVILKMEQLGSKHIGPLLTITQVVSIKMNPIKDSLFSPPNNFELVNDVNEARKIDRRLLEEEAAVELENNPLSKIEQQKFFGKWLLKKENNQLLIHIQSNGMGIDFKVTNLTMSDSNSSSANEYLAKLLGRKLLVEDPPTYKLYTLNYAKDTLINLENPFLEFVKVIDSNGNNQ